MTVDMRCGCGKEGKYIIGMSDGTGVYSCNKMSRCPSYDEVLAHVGELRTALVNYRDAMELTRQYVGYKTLPEIEGWSWFDADEEAKRVLRSSMIGTKITDTDAYGFLLNITENMLASHDLEGVDKILGNAKVEGASRLLYVGLLRSTFRVRGKLSKWFSYRDYVADQLIEQGEDAKQVLRGLYNN